MGAQQGKPSTSTPTTPKSGSWSSMLNSFYPQPATKVQTTGAEAPEAKAPATKVQTTGAEAPGTQAQTTVAQAPGTNASTSSVGGAKKNRKSNRKSNKKKSKRKTATKK